MKKRTAQWAFGVWLVAIAGFALLHALHLRADFPNNTPWFSDWAKYTDEGWYGNAAIRAHLFGNWYHPGDLNPAVALPVVPFLEWIVFFFTGVTAEAARGLGVAFFFANLFLSYLLLRRRVPHWAGMLAVTLLATSPFCYCFSRLAILEQPLATELLLALNLIVRMKQWRRQIAVAAGLGMLFAVMMLTKTTAVFLMPAMAWALAMTFKDDLKRTLQCTAAAAVAAAAVYGCWLALVIRAGLIADFHYLFFINKYPKPHSLFWPLVSLKWSIHGGLWIGHILFPLAAAVLVGAFVAWRRVWGRELLLDPVFGASVLSVAGYIGFMAYQNHPQPRYFAVVALFSFLVIAQGAAALLGDCYGAGRGRRRVLGWALIALAAVEIVNGAGWIINRTLHPEYTFARAAEGVTNYIDAHPNGNRLLLTISDDEIMLMTHLPGMCDDFGTRDLVSRTIAERPGWYATWNDLDPGTLEDLHTHFTLEQVAQFPAFDDPDRNMLVLFKLHPLPGGHVRDYDGVDLQNPLPGDKIKIEIDRD